VIDLRRAHAGDVDHLVRIRSAVHENRLRDPASVSRADYDWFIAHQRLWLAETCGRVAGFAAGDPRDGTIWALFVDPDCEGLGLGAMLLGRVCEDLKADGHTVLNLSTDPGTKAARLYAKLGWEELGLVPDGEVAFRLVLSSQ
jgi:ribosomal protein S18 acetylase RimI-like enzyme